MNSHNHILILNSDSFINVFPSNSAIRFKALIPKNLDFCENSYEIALLNIYMSKEFKNISMDNLLVHCNIIEKSLVSDRMLNALRLVPVKKNKLQEFHPYYVKIECQRTAFLEIYLTSLKGVLPLVFDGALTCTVALRKVQDEH